MERETYLPSHAADVPEMWNHLRLSNQLTESWERMNHCCFRLLHLEMIHYTAKANWNIYIMLPLCALFILTWNTYWLLTLPQALFKTQEYSTEPIRHKCAWTFSVKGDSRLREIAHSVSIELQLIAECLYWHLIWCT